MPQRCSTANPAELPAKFQSFRKLIDMLVGCAARIEHGEFGVRVTLTDGRKIDLFHENEGVAVAITTKADNRKTLPNTFGLNDDTQFFAAVYDNNNM